ncbi:MAG: alpha-L-arabinofuranosidase C-terminal domain-containing protein, partial [Asticcacaulis sp.]
YFPLAQNAAPAQAATPPGRPFSGVRNWQAIGGAGSVEMDRAQPYVGKQSVLIHLQPGEERGISQAGLGIAKARKYTGHIVVNAPAGATIHVALIWADGADGRQEATFTGGGSGWQTFPFEMTAGADTPSARFEITVSGSGDARIGTVSLMPADNIDGWRADTTAIARSLHSGFWRMPGGNFLSDWDWHGAIGPRDFRAPVFDHAWDAMQTNDIGMDEWLTLARLVGTEPYLTVNAGLGDANSAAEEVEYINGAATTEWGAKRAANGHPQPYGVKFWNIGNEPYGMWQIGVTQLKYYVLKHKAFADAMLAKDPTITLLASGAMPDQGKGHGEKINMTPAVAETRYNSEEDWTGGLIGGAGETFRGITEHWYDTGEVRPDAPPTDELLEYVRSPSNHVRMKAVEWEHYRKAFPIVDRNHIFLSIDEYAYMGADRKSDTLKTTLAYGMVFQEMLRHTDFLKMSAFTTGASTMDISPTAARLNATGLVFKFYGEHFGEGVIPVTVNGDSPQHDPKYVVGYNHPQVNAGSPTWPLDVLAALSPDRTALRVGVVNATASSQPIALTLKNLAVDGPVKRWVLTGSSVQAVNHLGAPDGVSVTEDTVSPGNRMTVPPISLTVFEYRLKK